MSLQGTNCNKLSNTMLLNCKNINNLEVPHNQFKYPLNNINCSQLNKQNPDIMTSDAESKENLSKGPRSVDERDALSLTFPCLFNILSS